MEENNNLKISVLNFIKEKPLVLLALSLFVIAVFLSVFLFSTKKENKNEAGNVTPTITEQDDIGVAKKDKTTINAPRVYFKEYENRSDSNISPFLKTKDFSYFNLKTDFTNEEALSFAQKLGLKEIKSSNNFYVAYNFAGKEKKGLLELNKSTGAFVFQSYGILKPSTYTKNQSKVDEVIAFLKDIELYDDTISCTNTFEKKSDPWEVTYIECHRDWEKTGIPIVNLGGALNIAENKKISELKVGDVDNFSPLNDLITNVKKVNASGALLDNSEDNNRARPNDFNTITFGIANDGRILTIESNLRWIKEEKPINKSYDLIAVDEAINIFRTNKYKYALTIPSGDGILDLDKVYPENKAISQKAIINEILLVYLDKNNGVSLEEYEPYYLFRGLATLESGYLVKFAEAIPALKNKQSAVNLLNKSVAGEKTYLAQKKKIQIDYFNPSQMPTSVLTPTRTIGITVTPTIINGVPSRYPCIKRIDEMGNGLYERTVNVPGYGDLTIVALTGHHTFYFKSSTAQDQSINAVKRAFFTGPVAEQYIISVSKYINLNEGQQGRRQPAIQLNTIEDVYKLFDKMNNPTLSPILDKGTKSDPFPAPITVDISDPTDPLFMYNKEMMDLVAGNVARKILELKRENKLSVYAAKENIFIPETLFGFQGVFFQGSGDMERQWRMGLCYISGGSPVIYLYPARETKISIKTGAPLTYVDPLIDKDTWNVFADTDGRIEQNGIARDSLYYEYDKSKVSFDEPKDGFVIEYDKWKEFVKNDMSKRLGLNVKETESLITEINNALYGLKQTKYLKLSLISEAELNRKLPLLINPKPDNLYRINVFVKLVDTNESDGTNRSNEFYVKRDGFTVVEVGAATK